MNKLEQKRRMDDWTDEEEDVEDEQDDDFDDETERRDDTVAALLTLADGSNEEGVHGGAFMHDDEASELHKELSYARRMQVKVSRMFLAASATFEAMGTAVLELGVPLDEDTVQNMKFTEDDVDTMVGALQEFSEKLKDVCIKVGARTGRQVADDLKREVALNTAPHPTAPPSHATPQPTRVHQHEAKVTSAPRTSNYRATGTTAGPSTATRILPPSSSATFHGRAFKPSKITFTKATALVGAVAMKPRQSTLKMATLGKTATLAKAPSSSLKQQRQVQSTQLAIFDDDVFEAATMPMLTANETQGDDSEDGGNVHPAVLALPSVGASPYGAPHDDTFFARSHEKQMERSEEITPAKLMASMQYGEMSGAKRDISRALGISTSSVRPPSNTTSRSNSNRHQPYARTQARQQQATTSTAIDHEEQGELIASSANDNSFDGSFMGASSSMMSDERAFE